MMKIQSVRAFFMVSRKKGVTEAQFAKWIKEGRGSGEHADYKPWLTVRDLLSLGRLPAVGVAQRSHTNPRTVSFGAGYHPSVGR